MSSSKTMASDSCDWEGQVTVTRLKVLMVPARAVESAVLEKYGFEVKVVREEL